MKKISLIFASLLCSGILQAQQLARTPKLVVSVTIDQLRSDYLNYFWDSFGERGFKRLYKEGVLFPNVRYGFPNVDKSSSAATLHTGAYPFVHGIAHSNVYDKIKQKLVPCIDDPAYMGNATAETVSPVALQTSTVGDELKIATQGKGKSYTVAPDLHQAVLASGHISDGTFWLDDYTGKWASTTYYKQFPWFMDNYNLQYSLEKQIPDLGWLPVGEPQSKVQLPFVKKEFPFMHIFSKEDKLKEYVLFKTSGLVNREINNVVFNLLKHAPLGKSDEYPDLLNIFYYAGNYQNKNANEFSLEIKDIYQRLDTEIECLLDSLDKNVGLRNTLLSITSSGYSAIDNIDEGQFNVTGGEFFPKRCLALLSMYLVAVYGNGNWVDGLYNDQIYLNRKLIEEKNISFDEIQRRSAEFVIQLAGVQDAIPASNLMHGYFNNQVMESRNGYSKKASGDLLLKVQPGWVVRFEDPLKQDYTVRDGAICFPLIFFGMGFKPELHNREVYVAEIAPTISAFLHIRSPNGAKERPMIEILTNDNLLK